MTLTKITVTKTTDPAPGTGPTDAQVSGVRVGIVGGGASGALVAARLLRDARTRVDVVVFDPRAVLGRGVAYDTEDALHLLNVPACNMSALPEDREHFRRWAGCGKTDFVSRARYGEYLTSLLAASEAAARDGSTLTHVRDEVVDLDSTPTPWVVTSRRERFALDAIVLATGHDEPVVPAALAGLPDAVITRNPWQPAALDAIAAGDEVLVVGTGLTFVDVALTILAKAPDARIHAISRFGLLPKAHEDPWRPAHPAPDLPTDNVDPLAVRAYVESFGDDWRRGIDSLRPITADLWQGMDASTRDYFVEHLARHWNVHRHRMAPVVAAAFDEFLRSGRIVVHGASVSAAEVAEDRVRAELSDGQTLSVDHVVVCTGPSGDMTGSPLGRELIRRGIAVPGPLDVGYLVDPSTGALVGPSGEPDTTILTMGPLRRGVLWESVAMPEIRVQAADVADAILASADQAVRAH